MHDFELHEIFNSPKNVHLSTIQISKKLIIELPQTQFAETRKSSRLLFSDKDQEFPKRPDEATKVCASNLAGNGGMTTVSVRWATPCDGIIECYDGSDENACNPPTWLIPIILLTATVVLCFAQLFTFNMYVKKNIAELFGNFYGENQQFSGLATSKCYKLLYIAILTESEHSIDEMRHLVDMESKAHGSEGKVLCCFKVIHNLLTTKTFLSRDYMRIMIPGRLFWINCLFLFLNEVPRFAN